MMKVLIWSEKWDRGGSSSYIPCLCVLLAYLGVPPLISSYPRTWTQLGADTILRKRASRTVRLAGSTIGRWYHREPEARRDQSENCHIVGILLSEPRG